MAERTVPLREAALRLGLTPEALRKRIEKGQLPATREAGGRRRYLIPESALADLAADIGLAAHHRAGTPPAGDDDPGPVRRLRVVGEGELPVEAIGDFIALLQQQFAALAADRDRLQGELGRLQGELDNAEVRNAALEAEVGRLRRRLAEAPAHFLSELGRLSDEWHRRS